MSEIPTWWTVLVIILGIYAVGMVAMWAYTRNVVMGVLWPMTILWMLFGNIQ